MNKCKYLSIANLILEIIACVFLFVDGVYKLSWSSGPSDVEHSVFDSITIHYEINRFWGVVLITSLIVAAILLTIQLIAKKTFFISLVFSIIQFGAFLLYTEAVFNTKLKLAVDVYGIGTHGTGLLYYLYIIIFISIIVISIASLALYKKTGKVLVKNENIETKQEIPQSNADELKKYKDLLDSGVITQEEFDQKKKQLLGL